MVSVMGFYRETLFGRWLVILLCAACTPRALAATAEPFSDPSLKIKVPAGWVEKPVQHDKRYHDADLVLALGQQTYPVLKQYIEEFGSNNGLRIVIQRGTCGISAGKMLRKSVDLAAYCCPPSRTDRLPTVEFHSLGIAPIALITHEDNPIQSISLQQAREIFQGKISRWTGVKPTPSLFDKSIQPVGRLHCKIRPGHWRSLLPKEDMFSARLYEVGVIPDMISQVSRNPGAIGWETPLMVKQFADRGKVKMLDIDNMKPTDLTHLLNGDWPIYRTYHLAVWSDGSRSNKLALNLIGYLQDKIEEIHKEIGFVSPSELRKAGWVFAGNELIAPPKRP